MTIKQQGGVFGRNPTFNNVEVDGTATLDNIASSDKLRVTASDNPAAYIEFENTFQNTGVSSQAGLLLGVNSSVQTNYAGVIATENGVNSNAVFLGLYANNGSGPLLVAQARNNKNFEIVDGNLVVANGKGIDFSATSGTGTSELFDDYEEGTWTPTIIGRSSAGTGTYTTQRGMYTKVGDTVFFYAILNWSAHTGTGNMAIDGLPFTTFGTIGHNPTMAVMGNNLTFSGQLSAIIDRNATTITIITFASGGAASELTMDTAGGIYVSGFYKAA